MRRIRREFLHLLLPQLHTLAKLLLVVLLSTLLLFTYKKARLQNISVSLDAMAKQRDIENTDKVVENDLKTTIPLSVISRTHLEHKTTQLSLSISTKEVVTMATTITSDDMEKSSSRLRISQVKEDVVKDDEVKREHESKQHYLDADVVSGLMERGKEQQVLVEQFCEHHNLSHQALRLPDGNTDCLYQHLLVSDKTGTLFCYIPKVGCTNLKLLFFVTMGLIPRSQLQESRDGVDQDMLLRVRLDNSFIGRNNTQRNFALNHYFKFMMYRNPLERLLSGYRSKVERFPLTGLEDKQPHFNWLRKAIYNSTHPAIYQQFLLSGGVSSVNISFSDFVDYWLTKPESLEIDEHFRSMFSLCEPCRTRYSFYGNFKNFSTDSQVLIKKIHTTPQFLRSGYYNRDSSTGVRTQRYYRQLSSAQKMNIVELLKLDLDFYHHLFPGEELINQSILS